MVQKRIEIESEMVTSSTGMSSVRSADKETTAYLQLIRKLKDAVAKSCIQHSPNTMNQETCEQRDCAVSTIKSMVHFYGSGPETFSTAVYYLDRFLSKVNVQARYFSCMATACFYLAAKFHEETEDIPSATQLSCLHQRAWKPSDLKRMETAIITKLDWDLWPRTCPTFIKLFCDIMDSLTNIRLSYPHFLHSIIQQFEVCINFSFCAIFSTSSIALSLLHLSLKRNGLLSESVSQCFLYLHYICQTQDSEFHECYSTVLKLLDCYDKNLQNQPACLPMPKPFVRPTLICKPSLYGDSELPTIEENILPENDDMNTVVQYCENSFIVKGSSWSRCILPPDCDVCTVE